MSLKCTVTTVTSEAMRDNDAGAQDCWQPRVLDSARARRTSAWNTMKNQIHWYKSFLALIFLSILSRVFSHSSRAQLHIGSFFLSNRSWALVSSSLNSSALKISMCPDPGTTPLPTLSTAGVLEAAGPGGSTICKHLETTCDENVQQQDVPAQTRSSTR